MFAILFSCEDEDIGRFSYNIHFMPPFYGCGSTGLKAKEPLQGKSSLFFPRSSWYSFYRPRKDERLSWLWSHPEVLNLGPLDWESSSLTTTPLLHKSALVYLLLYNYLKFIIQNFWKQGKLSLSIIYSEQC